VVREIPHDPAAFTQGLVVVDDLLYESTGLVGHSSLRAVDPASGDVVWRRDVDPDLFAEGLAEVDGTLVQLTWRDGVALRWRLAADPGVAATPEGRSTYEGEGWGLTTLDDGGLAMSDGSDRITERDPDDLAVLRTWTVARTGGPADRLNELEWDGRRLWANRWGTDEILGIDPACRQVVDVVDAGDLSRRAARLTDSTDAAVLRPPGVGDGDAVLNGIAHVPGTDRYLLTGKLWPVIFEVELDPA
jgi:glutaminyl-peptide cyclotransferase